VDILKILKHIVGNFLPLRTYYILNRSYFKMEIIAIPILYFLLGRLYQAMLVLKFIRSTKLLIFMLFFLTKKTLYAFNDLNTIKLVKFLYNTRFQRQILFKEFNYVEF
jgi:hypothetical protein